MSLEQGVTGISVGDESCGRMGETGYFDGFRESVKPWSRIPFDEIESKIRRLFEYLRGFLQLRTEFQIGLEDDREKNEAFMNPIAPFPFDPYDPEFRKNPYPFYDRLRSETPIFYHGDWDLWFFTTFEDISALLGDKRLGRTMDHVLSPEEVAEKRRAANWERLPYFSRYVRQNFMEKEGADHARLRKLAYKVLTPKRVRGLAPRIQEITDRLIDKVEGRGRMDFIKDLATPMPVLVIAELLGVPEEERHRLCPWSEAITKMFEPAHSQLVEENAEQSAKEFSEFLLELVARRKAKPRDDLISALAAVEDEGDRLSIDELIATCMFLLNAGHETLVNSAGNGMLALLRHPEQLEKLKSDPSLTKLAVEEMLRYDSPLHLFKRWILEDMTYKDIAFKKGDQVALLYGSANRDPTEFENPDIFDITRRHNPHLAFGKGVHFCIGAPLARMELQITIDTVLRRLPGIRLADANPKRLKGFVFRGVEELPVEF